MFQPAEVITSGLEQLVSDTWSSILKFVAVRLHPFPVIEICPRLCPRRVQTLSETHNRPAGNIISIHFRSVGTSISD